MAIVPFAWVQSGYPVIANYGDPELIPNPLVPGSSAHILGGLRRGAVATVLLYYAARFNREVESLGVDGDDWGYDKRNIRGGTGFSNHAGGCAVDLNSTKHPQHRRGTFSAAQYATMRRIAAEAASYAGGSVYRLGIDWNDASVDEMHVEIAVGAANTGRIEKFADAILAGRAPHTPPEMVGRGDAPRLGVLTIAVPGVSVSDVQTALNRNGAKLIVDGDAGPATLAAVKAFQAAGGLNNDGIVGPKTWAALEANKQTQEEDMQVELTDTDIARIVSKVWAAKVVGSDAGAGETIGYTWANVRALGADRNAILAAVKATAPSSVDADKLADAILVSLGSKAGK